MKNPRLRLYGICICACFGILMFFVGYTFPTQTLTQPAHDLQNTGDTPQMSTEGTDAVVVTAMKKGRCGCCTERQARLQKQRQQARARKRAQEKTVQTALP